MTTFRLSFTDPKAAPDKRFLGVAIVDMDESRLRKPLSARAIVKEASRLGINPGGGQVRVDELFDAAIPDKYRRQLITNKELLLQVESMAGAAGIDNHILDEQYNCIRATFGKDAANHATYGRVFHSDEGIVHIKTKIYTPPRPVIVSKSLAPFTEITHRFELCDDPDDSDKRAPTWSLH